MMGPWSGRIPLPGGAGGGPESRASCHCRRHSSQLGNNSCSVFTPVGIGVFQLQVEVSWCIDWIFHGGKKICFISYVDVLDVFPAALGVLFLMRTVGGLWILNHSSWKFMLIPRCPQLTRTCMCTRAHTHTLTQVVSESQRESTAVSNYCARCFVYYLSRLSFMMIPFSFWSSWTKLMRQTSLSSSHLREDSKHIWL